MANVSKGFVNETLWPEFQEIFETLQSYLSDVTDRVVHQVIHQDHSEAEVVKKSEQTLFAEIDRLATTASNQVPASTKRDRSAEQGANDQSEGNSKNKRKKRKKRKHRK